MSEAIRVAVTGAAGQIGYGLVFRIASGGLFGPDQRVRLQLLGSSGRESFAGGGDGAAGWGLSFGGGDCGHDRSKACF